MNMSPIGLALTESFEGLRLVAYKPLPTDRWTIGYGHVKGVYQGMTCTVQQAQQWLLQDIASSENAVNQLVQVPLNQNQFDALVDFVFNVGDEHFRGSTLLRKLNSQDYQGAAAEFPRWNMSAGNVVPGLTRRRLAEQSLFLKED